VYKDILTAEMAAHR